MCSMSPPSKRERPQEQERFPEQALPETGSPVNPAGGKGHCVRCELDNAVLICETCDAHFCYSCSASIHQGRLAQHEFRFIKLKKSESEMCGRCEETTAVLNCNQCGALTDDGNMFYCDGCHAVVHQGRLANHAVTHLKTSCSNLQKDESKGSTLTSAHRQNNEEHPSDSRSSIPEGHRGDSRERLSRSHSKDKMHSSSHSDSLSQSHPAKSYSSKSLPPHRGNSEEHRIRSSSKEKSRSSSSLSNTRSHSPSTKSHSPEWSDASPHRGDNRMHRSHSHSKDRVRSSSVSSSSDRSGYDRRSSSRHHQSRSSRSKASCTDAGKSDISRYDSHSSSKYHHSGSRTKVSSGDTITGERSRYDRRSSSKDRRSKRRETSRSPSGSSAHGRSIHDQQHPQSDSSKTSEQWGEVSYTRQHDTGLSWHGHAQPGIYPGQTAPVYPPGSHMGLTGAPTWPQPGNMGFPGGAQGALGYPQTSNSSGYPNTPYGYQISPYGYNLGASGGYPNAPHNQFGYQQGAYRFPGLPCGYDSTASGYPRTAGYPNPNAQPGIPNTPRHSQSNKLSKKLARKLSQSNKKLAGLSNTNSRYDRNSLTYVDSVSISLISKQELKNSQEGPGCTKLESKTNITLEQSDGNPKRLSSPLKEGNPESSTG